MTTPRLGIIVFARMSSHRLPGKVLMDFGGRPLLAHIIARAAALGQPVIVATSDQSEDAAVADLALACGAAAYRGPLDDVLQRAVDAARHHGLDAFARLCGDRPYFPQDQMRAALDAMATSLASDHPADLVTNHIPENPPPGLSTEVVRVAALERALVSGVTAHHREHLTSHVYDHAASFAIHPVAADFSGLRGRRYAIDTPNDLETLNAVARRFNDIHVSPRDVAALMTAAVIWAEDPLRHG